MKSPALFLCAGILVIGCSGAPKEMVPLGQPGLPDKRNPSSRAPRATISTKGFPITAFDSQRVKKGEATHGEAGVRFGGVARDNFIRFFGKWHEPHFQKYDLSGRYYGQAAARNWFVEVHPAVTAAQRDAIEHARDGYAARLGVKLNASARIYPRFARKSFPWGRAVSFFVQYQNDNSTCVPNNGMLTYEVHGVTGGGCYVRASFGVTHRSLPEYGPGVSPYRETASDPNSPMRRDAHYRLAETAEDSTFQPSLAKIDKFLSTLVIK